MADHGTVNEKAMPKARRSARRRYMSTVEVARAVGVHPNTVRLYEEWGFLPQIPRGRNGYRRFTEDHLDLMRLARTALQFPYPGGKAPVLELIQRAKAGDLEGAISQARLYLSQVRAEEARADEAAALMERWAQRRGSVASGGPLRMRQAANLLGITVGALRNWTRNGLIDVPRDPRNGYGSFGSAEMDRLRVIRVLRSAGYSTVAVLRMLRHLDEGADGDLRRVLDTPPADDDVVYFTDRWLSTLAEQKQRAIEVIAQLQEMLRKRQ